MRGQGIGSFLLAHAVDWLRLGRCERVAFVVGTDEEGLRASHLYRRCGWRRLGRQTVSWAR